MSKTNQQNIEADLINIWGEDTFMWNEKMHNMRDNQYEVADFVENLFKNKNNTPKISFDSYEIRRANPNARAIYDTKAKEIILEDDANINNPDVRESIMHELLHYLDDLAVEDRTTMDKILGKEIGDPADGKIAPKFATDDQSGRYPEDRYNILKTGWGTKEKRDSTGEYTGEYELNPVAGRYARANLNPKESLTYPTGKETGGWYDDAASEAALNIVNRNKMIDNPPLKPLYNATKDLSVLNIVRFVEDKNAAFNLLDSLAGEYLTDSARTYYRSRMAVVKGQNSK